MSKLLEKISTMFLAEDGKNLSSQRVIAVIVSVVWTLVISIMWIVMSIQTGGLAALDTSIVQLYIGALSVIWGAKVASSVFAEAKIAVKTDKDASNNTKKTNVQSSDEVKPPKNTDE